MSSGTDLMDLPDLPCGHRREGIRRRGYRAICSACGSFWDTDSLKSDMVYDESYPETRFHFDPAVGNAKVRTLRRWLNLTGIVTEGLRACEVGFGGGYCLRYINEVSETAYGIEAVRENMERAAEMGIERGRLFSSEDLPESLPGLIDIWFFLDSFEHLPDPGGFMDWLRENSSPEARLFMVMPRAGSLSERLMGRLWPHKLPDHRFHWSRQGIEGLMRAKGFSSIEKRFYPLKFVPLKTVVGHLAAKLGAGKRPMAGAGMTNMALLLNFGEMGMVFRRDDEA